MAEIPPSTILARPTSLPQLLSMSAGIRGINPVYVPARREPGIRRLTIMVRIDD
jgi:hypothetical protein